MRLRPLAPVIRDDIVDPVVRHSRPKLRVIEHHDNRTHILAEGFLQLLPQFLAHALHRLFICMPQRVHIRLAHALDLVEDEAARHIHALCDHRQVDLQPRAAHSPREFRHLGVCLPRKTDSRHIGDSLHAVEQMHHFKVAEALEPDASVVILFLDFVRVFELFKDLSVVFRSRLILLRFRLTGEEVSPVGSFNTPVMVPEPFKFPECFRVLCPHLLHAVGIGKVPHLRLPPIRMASLILSQELLRQFVHFCPGAFHIAQPAAHL